MACDFRGTLTDPTSFQSLSAPIRFTNSRFNQRQSFDAISVFDMFFDDLDGVFGLDLGVERAVGVDHYGGADRAYANLGPNRAKIPSCCQESISKLRSQVI